MKNISGLITDQALQNSAVAAQSALPPGCDVAVLVTHPNRDGLMISTQIAYERLIQMAAAIARGNPIAIREADTSIPLRSSHALADVFKGPMVAGQILAELKRQRPELGALLIVTGPGLGREKKPGTEIHATISRSSALEIIETLKASLERTGETVAGLLDLSKIDPAQFAGELGEGEV